VGIYEITTDVRYSEQYAIGNGALGELLRPRAP
jgi:hypothetical protein